MSNAPRARIPIGLLVLLIAVAALVWGGWWLIGKVHLFYSGHDPSLVIAAITALLCTAILASAIHRGGAFRAARLRCRADAYEAALAIFLRRGRPVNPAEWRRIRARLILWASPKVFQRFTALEDEGFPLPLGDLSVSEKLEAVISAMRVDLGQSGYWIVREEEREETDEADGVDESEESEERDR